MTARAGQTEVVVVTQNVWGHAGAWPARRALLARRLGALRPHAIGLQEVHAPAVFGAPSQAHELADEIGGYETVFAPGRVEAGGACEGVALLCRLDVTEHAVEALTLDRDDPWEGDSQRIVLAATLDTSIGPVDVLVTHLSLSERARRRTVLELADFAARHERRSASIGAVLIGDFNALPAESAMRAVTEPGAPGGPWIDAWSAAHGARPRGGTWPAILPLRRIDYVLARPHARWRVEQCDRLPFSGSDHLGLYARLRAFAPR